MNDNKHINNENDEIEIANFTLSGVKQRPSDAKLENESDLLSDSSNTSHRQLSKGPHTVSNSLLLGGEKLQQKSLVSSKRGNDSKNHYKQLLLEAEQSVSSRDNLIEMLQKQLKKIESLYKQNLDDSQSLRYKYCLTTQELGNLKKICEKYRDDIEKLSRFNRECGADAKIATLEKEIENWKTQYEDLLRQVKEESQQKVPREMQTSADEDGDVDTDIHTLKEDYEAIKKFLQQQNEKLAIFLQKLYNDLIQLESTRNQELEFDPQTYSSMMTVIEGDNKIQTDSTQTDNQRINENNQQLPPALPWNFQLEDIEKNDLPQLHASLPLLVKDSLIINAKAKEEKNLENGDDNQSEPNEYFSIPGEKVSAGEIMHLVKGREDSKVSFLIDNTVLETELKGIHEENSRLKQSIKELCHEKKCNDIESLNNSITDLCTSKEEDKMPCKENDTQSKPLKELFEDKPLNFYDQDPLDINESYTLTMVEDTSQINNKLKDKLNRTLEELDAVKKDLNNKVRELEEKDARLQDLYSNLCKLQNDLRDKQADIDDIRLANDVTASNLNKAVEELHLTKQDLNKKINDLEEKELVISNLHQEIEQIKGVLTNPLKTCGNDEATNKLQGTFKKLDAVTDDIEKRTAELLKKEEQLQKLHELVEQMMLELATNNRSLANMSNENEQLKNNLNSALKQIERLTNESDGKNKAIKNNEITIQSLRDKIEKLAVQLSETTENYRKALQENDKLKKEIHDKVEFLNGNIQNNQQLEKKQKEVQAALDEKSKDEPCSRCFNDAAELSRTVALMEKLKRDNEKAMSQIDKMAKTLDQYKEEAEFKKLENEKLRMKEQQLQQSLLGAQRTAENIMKDYKQKIYEHQKTLADISKEYHNFKQHCQCKITKIDGENAEMGKKLQAKEKEMEDLRKKCEELDAALKSEQMQHQEDLKRHDKSLSEISFLYKDKENELSRLRGLFEMQEKKLKQLEDARSAIESKADGNNDMQIETVQQPTDTTRQQNSDNQTIQLMRNKPDIELKFIGYQNDQNKNFELDILVNKMQNDVLDLKIELRKLLQSLRYRLNQLRLGLQSNAHAGPANRKNVNEMLEYIQQFNDIIIQDLNASAKPNVYDYSQQCKLVSCKSKGATGGPQDDLLFKRNFFVEKLKDINTQLNALSENYLPDTKMLPLALESGNTRTLEDGNKEIGPLQQNDIDDLLFRRNYCLNNISRIDQELQAPIATITEIPVNETCADESNICASSTYRNGNLGITNTSSNDNYQIYPPFSVPEPYIGNANNLETQQKSQSLKLQGFPQNGHVAEVERHHGSTCSPPAVSKGNRPNEEKTIETSPYAAVASQTQAMANTVKCKCSQKGKGPYTVEQKTKLPICTNAQNNDKLLRLLNDKIQTPTKHCCCGHHN